MLTTSATVKTTKKCGAISIRGLPKHHHFRVSVPYLEFRVHEINENKTKKIKEFTDY